MTRKQQNQVIIEKLTGKLADMPNVQNVISDVFTEWFQALVEQGMQQTQPAPTAEPTAPAA
jgi:O-methyltransferase involved in polyketide biosynthesis